MHVTAGRPRAEREDITQGTIALVDEHRTGITRHLGDQRSVRSTPKVEAPGGRDRGDERAGY
jgi:hypothetical protein